MKYLLFPILLLPVLASAQSAEEIAFKKKYEENIQLEYINDIYIPTDVMDAMTQIDLLSNEEGRAKMLEANEQVVSERLVKGLGKWMTLKWNFYEGSRLSHHLKEYGVSHPDDMSRFLIVSYHRYLREVPLELKERGQALFDQRKADQEKRNAKRKVIRSN